MREKTRKERTLTSKKLRNIVDDERLIRDKIGKMKIYFVGAIVRKTTGL